MRIRPLVCQILQNMTDCISFVQDHQESYHARTCNKHVNNITFLLRAEMAAELA